MKHILLAILMICYGNTMSSQCEFDIDVPIFSQELGQYEIVVSDLQQFDLASDQALCGVRLHFEHTSLTNIRISLISPDGDRVYLVGPATVAPTISDFTDWDVEFVPCNSPAAPDIDIPDQWSNNSNWNNIETYEGSYYPAGGCLEDFDSGSANGIWTIEIEDLGELNEGTLHSVELIFCNTDGLACHICDAQVLDFNSEQQLYCEGDKSVISPDQLITQSDGLSLVPVLILVQNDQILEITQDPLQVELLAQGTYKIYGAVILDGSDFSSYVTLQALEAVLVGGSECGDLSTESIDLVILEVLNTETISESICKNEPYVWNDQVFTAPLDTIVYTFDQSGACSTSTEITLTLEESGLEISESFEVVECGEEIVLTATVIDSNQEYLWTTLNGSIVNGSNTPFVIVNQPGTYYLYGVGDCIPSDSIVLAPAGNFDQVSIAIDSDDCSSNSATLSIDSELAISSFYWLGPGIEGSTAPNPSINQNGDYGVVVFSNDFVCDSIILYQSYTMIESTVQSVLKSNDLDCLERSSQLYLEIDEALLLDSKWYTPNGALIGGGLTAIANKGGVYTVVVSYLNGCSETLSINVADSKIVYDLAIDLVLLDCSTQEGLATVVSSGPIESVIWTGPFGYYSDEISAELNSYGTYRAIVVYADGCRQSIFFEADYNDSTSPVVEIEHDPIDCNNDCGILYVTSGHDPSYSYRWAGPSGFQSSLFNPKVFNPGNYFVTVTDSDGCESIYFEFVGSNTEGIEFTILAEELTCVNLSTDLIMSTSYTQIETFTWSGPDIDAGNAMEEIPVVSVPGMYTLSGIGTNGCEFEESVEVLLNNTTATITNAQEIFNIECQGTSTTLEVIADMPLTGYIWSVPFEFGPTLTTSEPGAYSVTVTNENLCTSVADFTVTQNDVIALNLIPTEINLTCDMPTSILPIEVTSQDPNFEVIIERFEVVSGDGVTINGTLITATEGELILTEAGEYTVTVILENGCLLTEVFTVTEMFDTIPPEVDIPVFNCYSPDGIEVTLINADQYTTIEWNDTDVILGSNESYLYTDSTVPLGLYLVDVNGCITDLELVVTVEMELPDFSLIYEESQDCEQVIESITASLESGVTYEWSTLDGQILSDPSLQMIQVQGSGNYACSVTNIQSGCTDTKTQEILTETGIGEIDLQLVQPSCDNNSLIIVEVNLDGQTALSDEYTVLLNGSEITVFPVFIMDEGQHLITITNLQGCAVDTMIVVELIPTFTLSIDPLYTVEEGESVEVVLGLDSVLDISDFEIEWSGDSESVTELSEVYTPLNTGDYRVTVTDSFGCSQMLEFIIQVKGSTDVFVPNIFKLGAAGLDGTLTISAPKSNTMQMQVYDRWGNLVFRIETDEPQIQWDGTIGNTSIEQGVYILSLQVGFNDVEPIRQISDITIIR